jgi:hypothetical protein
LQALDRRGGQQREEVDVLVAEQPAGGAVLERGERRIVVEPQAELRPLEAPVVEVRIARALDCSA